MSCRTNVNDASMSLPLARTFMIPHPACDVSNDSEEKVNAIAEPSVTADGKYLYFVYRQRLSSTQTDFSIGVARNGQTTDPWE